ncbi:MAG: tetratricopeptide repeat protein, partial [Pseudomonadota bacterium]
MTEYTTKNTVGRLAEGSAEKSIATAGVALLQNAYECFEQGHTKECISLCQQALDMLAPNAFTHNLLGVAYGKIGQHAQALAHLKQAHEIAPDNKDNNSALGLAYSALRDHKRAVQHASRACEIDVDCMVSLCNLMHVYIENKEFAKVIDLAESCESKTIDRGVL